MNENDNPLASTPPAPQVYWGHHYEAGWNGIELMGVRNCWVRDVEFVNSDSGVLQSCERPIFLLSFFIPSFLRWVRGVDYVHSDSGARLSPPPPPSRPRSLQRRHRQRREHPHLQEPLWQGALRRALGRAHL